MNDIRFSRCLFVSVASNAYNVYFSGFYSGQLVRVGEKNGHNLPIWQVNALATAEYAGCDPAQRQPHSESDWLSPELSCRELNSPGTHGTAPKCQRADR